jgi:hypothetical protein
METPTKPLHGAELVRTLRERKARIQQEAIEEYRTNPEIRAIYEQLREQNRQAKTQHKEAE